MVLAVEARKLSLPLIPSLSSISFASPFPPRPSISFASPFPPNQIPQTQLDKTKVVPPASNGTGKTPKFPFYSPSPLPNKFKNSPAPASGNSSVSSTPLRFFKQPFPPPSPAKHIRALLARRHGSVKPNEASIPEGSECNIGLVDKNFGFSKQFVSHYDLRGLEIDRESGGVLVDCTQNLIGTLPPLSSVSAVKI